MDWQIADAKKRLTDVVTYALTEGPQRLLRKNDVVVVISETEFERLGGNKPSFKAYLTEGPSFADFDLTREADPLFDLGS